MSTYKLSNNCEANELDLKALVSASTIIDAEAGTEHSVEITSQGGNRKLTLSVMSTLLLLLVAGGSAGQAVLRGNSSPPPSEDSSSRASRLRLAKASTSPVPKDFPAHLRTDATTRHLPSTSRELLQLQNQRELLGPVAVFVLGALAKGAVSKIGGDALGWVLNKVGLTRDDSQNIEDIKKEMVAQKQTLQQMQKSLKFLETQLAVEVERILTAIEDANEKAEFKTWVQTLNQNVGIVMGLFDGLRVWSQVEPSPLHAADINAFRSSILTSVPSAIRAINSALIGTGFSEGMIDVYARVAFKESSTVEEFAESFSLMFQYYYTYQIAGLQLVFEAHHAAATPVAQAITTYYEIWSEMIAAQIDQYRKRAPQTKSVRSWQANPDRTAAGAVVSLAVTNDRAYYLTSAGNVQSSALDGTDRRKAFTGLTYSGSYPLFRVVDETLYVGGCLDMTCRTGYTILKYDLALNPLGQATAPPSPGLVSSSRMIAVEPRGADMVGNQKLYALLCEQFAVCTVQAFDVGSMRHLPQESFSLPVTGSWGDLKMVSPTVAVIGDVGITVAQGAVVADVTRQEKLAYLNPSKGRYTTPSGSVLSVRRDPANSQRLHLQVTRSSNVQPQYYVLDGHPTMSSGRLTESVGNLVYGINGAASAAAAAATLVDPKAILQLPCGSLQGSTAVAQAGGYLYKVQGGLASTVVQYAYAYPFEYPEALN